MEDLIVKAVREAKRRSGIDFDENIRFNEVENGYEIVVYFRILERTSNPLRIKIDITKKENEVIWSNVKKFSQQT